MDQLKRHWFIVGLMAVLLIGLLAPFALRRITEWRTARDLIVALVLFATTLPLETRVIGQAVRRPWAPLLGSFINFGVLPLLAIGLARLLDDELATGLVVAAAAPCTIASAAVWTRRAGGNEIVALMVTAITNLLCFIVTPLWLSYALHQVVTIDLGPMIGKLGLLVLLPMAIGQLLRQRSTVAHWAAKHRGQLSVASQMGILSIVLVGAVHCGLRVAGLAWGDLTWSLLKLLAVVLVLHVSMLCLGFILGQWLKLPRGDWIAVGIAGSQKTLMVGLQVALMVGSGLVVVPMVVYHVSQLVVDTFVADRLSWAAEARDR